VDETLRRGRLRLQVSERLNKASRYLATDLIGRVLDIVQHELPAVAALLLGQSCAPSYSQLRHTALEFSPGEPAVNVYTAGGEFSPHEDKQALTLLVLLSPSSLCESDGTAFWSSCADRVAANPPTQQLESELPPALVLRPVPGDAILFAGHVTHGGCLSVGAHDSALWLASHQQRAPWQPVDGCTSLALVA
jgi:hypothetical protein